jgi:hypothetical protein
MRLREDVFFEAPSLPTGGREVGREAVGGVKVSEGTGLRRTRAL